MSNLSIRLAQEIEAQLKEGLDIIKVSRLAFDIYQSNNANHSPELDDVLLRLMAMEEGSEFELTEIELKDLVERLKLM